MFDGKNIVQILQMGGIALYILIFCSVISLAIIIERLFNYKKKSRVDKIKIMDAVKREVAKREIGKAISICDENEVPITAVIRAGLKKYGHDEKEISGAMEREIMVETVKLEQYTTIVGTIGNIAVYIGLFGTVIGIIRAFHSISVVGSGGISVIIGGVSEALIATATGLFVAIPAVIAYNYFVRRVDNFVTDMEYCASEIVDMIGVAKKTMKKPIKRAKLMSDINITPFTDVVLVLLIIFMLATPMLIQPGIKVSLPEVGSAEGDEDKNITIMITAKGEIFVDNSKMDMEAVKDRLIAKIANNPSLPVVIKGDKNIRYELVIQLMDIAKQSGAKKFALAVEVQKKNTELK